MAEEDTRWLTVPELAEKWPYSESTIRRWIDTGQLPGVQPGKRGRRKVRLADADAFAANGFIKVQADPPQG